MNGTIEKLIRNKVDRDGPDTFRSVFLSDFLAESGHRLDTAGLVRLAGKLADADLRAYLPAISSALRDIARDTDGSGAEFAGLARRIAGRVGRDPVQGPLLDSLADIGSDRPDLAVSVARLLVESGSVHQAAFLLGGAWRGAPAECWGVAEPLLRSKDASDVAAGVRSMHIAWKRHGIPDEADLFVALSGVAIRPDGAAAAEVMAALVDVYPAARDVDPLIEYMARRHAVCRAGLAARIQLTPSPFDDATALRYMIMCVEGEPEPQTVNGIHMALAWLAERDPETAVRVVVDHLFNPRCGSASMGYALQEIGRVSPRRLTAAILEGAAADCTAQRELSLPSIVNDVAARADLEEVLDPLFAALESGDDAAYRPALRMINAVVTRNYDTTRDSGQASRTLSRLVRYAQARGIDAEQATRTGCDNDSLKCSSLIDRLLHLPPRVDVKLALQNLEGFPALEKKFGPDWIKKEAAKGDGTRHPLVVQLSSISLEKIERLSAAPPGETPDECFNRLFRLRYELEPLETPAFLDKALALLEANKRCAAGYAKKMKNPDQFRDTVSEIALVAPFVAGGYEVDPEPAVGGKYLDAAIWLGPQRVLVEVLAPRVWEPLMLLEGPRKVPRRRIGRKIFDKVKGQLPAPGTCDDPVVVAVDMSRSEATPDDIESYALGPEVHEVAIDRRTGKTISYTVARDAEKCMHSQDPRTDSISAVVYFEQSLSSSLHASVQGKVIPNPHASAPLGEAALGALRRVLQAIPSSKERSGGGAP